MNDLIDRDHRDDDIRALLADARAAAPDPVPWNGVIERHDRRRASPRRGVWAVAAAVIVVGLLGLVVALQLRGDTGDVPADRPGETEPSEAPTTDLLADLGPDDWVIPSELPSGYDVMVAFTPGFQPTGSITIGGDEVADVYLYVSGSGFDDESGSVPEGATIEVGGATWTQDDWVDEDTGEVTVRNLQRPAGDRLVRLSTIGSLDDLLAIAERLEPVPAAQLDVPVLSAEGTFTDVATIADTSLAVIGVEGYYCVQLESVNGRTAGCGSTTKTFAPIAEGLTSGIGEGSITAGIARGDVARIEFLRPGGTSVVVEPTDQSGEFDDRFWIAEGPLTGDRAIVTYDDGSTVTVEQSLPGGMWAIVDEPTEGAGGAQEPALTDQLAGLGSGDWVEPVELPEGYDTAIAIDRAPDRIGLIVSGPDVNDVHVNVRFGDGDPIDGDTIDLGGATWGTNELIDEASGEIVGRRVERRAGEALITITAAGDSDSVFAVADALRPIDPADATLPLLSPDGPFTSVFTRGDLSVEVRGESGYYCVSLLTPDGTTSTGCGTTTSARAPLAYALRSDGPSEVFAAGVAEGDVARIEFLASDGDPVVVEPVDESGQFEERFWIAEGVNFFDTETVHRAIVTYDDGTTANVERSPLGVGWLLVDEP